MATNSSIRFIDLVVCLTDAMDFIDPAIVSHHRQVAYTAYSIGSELGLPPESLKKLVLAAALHDVGAFSLRERINTLEFEERKPQVHSETGYALLKLFSPLTDVAEIIRHHHVRWDECFETGDGEAQIPPESHILHLADRVTVLVDRGNEILGQARTITSRVRGMSGTKFSPELTDAFTAVAEREYFWLDLAEPAMHGQAFLNIDSGSFELSSDDMLDFAKLFARIIDFKSPFTATHSSGVATSAEMLSRYAGFAPEDSRLMLIAGYLHDLGKLAVPVEILDKPASLQEHERNVIRHHTFYTYRILQSIPTLQEINRWASYHHEKLDGSGYPFHISGHNLSIGSQIMAVADVFTALTENRPYRAGMTEGDTMRILNDMVKTKALNANLVSMLADNYDEMDSARMYAQAAATHEYRTLEQGVRHYQH